MPAISSRASWRRSWLAFRNGLISKPGFQRWAAGFPLTRPIARRRARALFDLVGGFVYSQVLFACVELRLFDVLAKGPMPIAELAARFGLSEDAATTLLKAAAALDLAERFPDGRFGLGQLGAALRGNPSLNAMIKHHAMLYADLADPVALLRGELKEPRLKAFWAYARNADSAAATGEQVDAYSALMAESQTLVAGEVLDAYSLAGHLKLLDIGGGEGVFLAAAGNRNRHLGLMLFDLPAVTRRAAERFELCRFLRPDTHFSRRFLQGPEFLLAPMSRLWCAFCTTTTIPSPWRFCASAMLRCRGAEFCWSPSPCQARRAQFP